MAHSVFANGRSVLWACGDAAAAVDTVAAPAEAIGFEPVKLGPLARARFVAQAALVWITASGSMGREFSWGVLLRSP